MHARPVGADWESMEPTPPHQQAAPWLAAAFSVHVFTACGAVCALLALLAAVGGNWTQMFAWLGVALIIDGIDGTFARRLRVADVLPHWSGDTLDLVVDYPTYVLVPAYAVAIGGVLPGPVALPLGLVIAVTGALYFADRRMKTSDSYFRGFPALWNAVAFYLFVLKPLPWFAALAIVVFAAATFAPIHFVHPIRVKRWHRLNVAASIAWAMLALLALARNLDPPMWASAALAALAVYFVIVGLLRGADPSLAQPR